MQANLTRAGIEVPATPEALAQAMAAPGVFWLDVAADPAGQALPGHRGLYGGDAEVRELLSTTFHLHPLVVDLADRFGQRPRIDDFGDVAFLVAHGPEEQALPTGTERQAAPARQPSAAPAGEPSAGPAGSQNAPGTPSTGDSHEIHFIIGANYVITVHRGPMRALDDVRAQIRERLGAGGAPLQGVLVYRVLEALIDRFFPVLSSFDDRIDELEDAILRQPTEVQLAELFDMKRQLLTMRKVIAPNATCSPPWPAGSARSRVSTSTVGPTCGTSTTTSSG